MPDEQNQLKQNMSNLRATDNFNKIFTEIAKSILANSSWTQQEKDGLAEAVQLLSEGARPQEIAKKVHLDEETNKKIADYYFLILLNTLIHCQKEKLLSIPMELPKEQVNEWPQNYSRNQFVADLLKHKESLSKSELGKTFLAAVQDYSTLYNSTVVSAPEQKTPETQAQGQAQAAAQPQAQRQVQAPTHTPSPASASRSRTSGSYSFEDSTPSSHSHSHAHSHSYSTDNPLEALQGLMHGFDLDHAYTKIKKDTKSAFTGMTVGTFARVALEVGILALQVCP